MISQTYHSTKNLNFTTSLTLVVGLASTLIVWGGQTIWPLALSLFGIYLVVTKKQKVFEQTQVAVKNALSLLTAIFILYVLIRSLMYLYHGDRFNIEPLVPFLLFPFIFVTISYANVQQKIFWIGIAIGGVAAAIFAAYQHFHLGIVRSYGFMNPIPFGDLCVAFSLVSIVGASGNAIGLGMTPLRMMLILSSVSAAYGSLLSGSKGGWLSLAMVIVFGCYRLMVRVGRSKRPIVLVLILTTLLVTGIFAPNHVSERVKNGFVAGQEWFKTGQVTDGSVSIRLELWKFGLILFKEAPLTGVSLEQWRSRRQELVDSGQLSPRILEIQTLDNEFIGNLAEGGAFGILNTMLLIVGPMLIFRRLLKSVRGTSADLVTVGVWIPIIFAEFGLSTSLWGQSAFRQVYVSWLILIIALVANNDRRSD